MGSTGFLGLFVGLLYAVLGTYGLFFREPRAIVVGVVCYVFSAMGIYLFTSRLFGWHEPPKLPDDVKLVKITYLNRVVYYTVFSKEAVETCSKQWLKEHALQHFIDDDDVDIVIGE